MNVAQHDTLVCLVVGPSLIGLCRYVSRAGAGSRGGGDRQFCYVNGRPVDLPKVRLLCSTAVASVWLDSMLIYVSVSCVRQPQVTPGLVLAIIKRLRLPLHMCPCEWSADFCSAARALSKYERPAVLTLACEFTLM